jgi:uncharacterized protein
MRPLLDASRRSTNGLTDELTGGLLIGPMATQTNALQTIIAALESVAVAFSGGVDSSYLLAVCCDVLGCGRVVAVVGDSPALPRSELDAAREVAHGLGVRLEVVPTNELQNAAYVRNDRRRCFSCKEGLFGVVWSVARRYGLKAAAYGATLDDMGDYRPGMEAAQVHGVRAPLLEAGLRKAEIRELSRQRGLPTWDKPAMACLASRVPYGTPVTGATLGQVEAAEAFLRDELGLWQVRVRHHGPVARLEVEAGAMARLVDAAVRERIVARLRDIGFVYVALDLAGFRSGSMNDV